MSDEAFDIVTVRDLTFLGRNARGHYRTATAGGREIVFPESEVEGTNLVKPLQKGWIEIPRWLAEEEDLAYEES